MLPSFLITLREGVEVSLIIGIILGTLSKLDRQHLRSSVWLGVGMASISRTRLQAFFRITSVLLILFSAGLVGHSVQEFNEANLIPAIVDPLWDVSQILSESSTLGQTLKALFGFNANPSLTEVIAYL